MKFITHHSISRASDDAATLWALASAHYPKSHSRFLDIATTHVIEKASSFALNARRSMEVLDNNKSYKLKQPRWRWNPEGHGDLVDNFREACNRIVHAQEFQVGFEDLPDCEGFIKNGSQVIPYIRAETDYKELAFIDPFALSYSFLYEVLPDLEQAKKKK
jgi:hypothetical protein